MPKRFHSMNRPSRARQRGFVVGVDLGASNLRVALASMDGSLVGKWRDSTKETASPEVAIGQIRAGVADLLARCSVRREELRAIGVGAPGATDASSGIVIATSYLGGWKNVPLRRALESALGIPADIENDVKIAAIGEHWRGAAGRLSDFVFLAVGTGIAAGIFVHGQLLRGIDASAGEVGYLIVPGTSEAPVRRGEAGPLESAIGGEGICAQWRRLNKRQHSGAATPNATEIFEMAQGGNPSAQSVLKHTSRILAYAIYNLSVVLNPSLFILGGGVGCSRVLLAETKSILKRYTEPAKPKLVLSTLREDAQLIGSVRLALDRANSVSAR